MDENSSPLIAESNADLNINLKTHFWSLWQIFLATAFFTPVAGAYFASKNYKLMQMEKERKKFLIIGVVLTLVVITILVVFLEIFFHPFPRIV